MRGTVSHADFEVVLASGLQLPDGPRAAAVWATRPAAELAGKSAGSVCYKPQHPGYVALGSMAVEQQALDVPGELWG